jgi:sugar phosphate isomerase/epimerase
MKPCISQATTMSTPFQADLPAFAQAGWPAFELWLTKLETFLEDHAVPEVQALVDSHGLVAAAASGQGGLLLSRSGERPAHWNHFRKRLAILRELEVPILIVAADHAREFSADEYRRAGAALREAADLAADSGVRLALEFQKTAGFCTSLDTALALVEESGSPHVGLCLDLFHYYTGPSKFEDLAHLSRERLAWVQLCDLSGLPRELAGDGDRILPGDGDFQLGPILDHLGRIGYDGYVSLEVTNPQLWQVPVDRLADLGHQSICRALGPWSEPALELREGA